jgi:hypothetical protein
MADDDFRNIKRKTKNMHLLLTSVPLASVLVIGGSSIGIILLIVLIVVLLR